MIATIDIKMCPFRKETNLVSVEAQNAYMNLGTCYQEDFLECIEKNCMAWHPETHSCLLMYERVKKKNE